MDRYYYEPQAHPPVTYINLDKILDGLPTWRVIRVLCFLGASQDGTEEVDLFLVAGGVT